MNNSLGAPLTFFNRPITLFISALLLLCGAVGVRAQSTEVESPTPVTANEISGTISARDIGDARLTRFFYALTGTPGDLIFTVESKNLDGDIDIFAANGLRPLAKVSMYSGESSTRSSKTIYLRRQEPLILRVEGRTPNDNPGTFRIRFEGSFEPLPVVAASTETANPAEGETSTAQPPSRTAKKGRRVTSVGGRIDEPEPEPTTTTAETSTTEPVKTPEQPPAPAEATASTTTTPESTAEPSSTKPTPTRTTRGRRGRGRNTPRPRPTAPATTSTTATAATEATQPGGQPAAQPEAGARLIIETRDGMRVERYMSTVRRVTVENGQIVVTMKNGKVERLSLTDVLRMAIEP